VTETYPPFSDDQAEQISQPAPVTPLPAQETAPAAPEAPAGFEPPTAPEPTPAPPPKDEDEDEEPPPGPFGPSSTAGP
jgi:hypothetical protein